MNCRKVILRLLFSVSLLTLTAFLACEVIVTTASRGRIHDRAADAPQRRVGLVLGTGKRLVGGRENLFFTRRMETAVALFNTGRVDYLLVSGDNGTRYHDEPTDMKKDLVARGVPAEKIYCDYAGFRTLDSMVRAKKVFGVDSCLVISQRFHCRRAIFLARARGLDAEGVAARDVPLRHAIKAWLRERLARVAAVLDIFVWNRQPRFLGDPVVLGVDPPPEPGDKTPRRGAP